MARGRRRTGHLFVGFLRFKPRMVNSPICLLARPFFAGGRSASLAVGISLKQQCSYCEVSRPPFDCTRLRSHLVSADGTEDGTGCGARGETRRREGVGEQRRLAESTRRSFRSSFLLSIFVLFRATAVRQPATILRNRICVSTSFTSLDPLRGRDEKTTKPWGRRARPFTERE